MFTTLVSCDGKLSGPSCGAHPVHGAGHLDVVHPVHGGRVLRCYGLLLCEFILDILHQQATNRGQPETILIVKQTKANIWHQKINIKNNILQFPSNSILISHIFFIKIENAIC